MGLERSMDSEMAGDMVPLSAAGATVLPFACETQVVGALAADMVVAEMVVEDLWVGEREGAVLPETLVLDGGLCRRLGRLWGGSSGLR